MKNFIKVNNSRYSISTALARHLKENHIGTQVKFKDKEYHFVLGNSLFQYFQPILTDSLTHFYVFISGKKYRICKGLFKILNIHNVKSSSIAVKQDNISTKTFLEVCAGAGGLSSGFIASNFKPVLLNDNNK
jgi:hypothetical protein